MLVVHIKMEPLEGGGQSSCFRRCLRTLNMSHFSLHFVAISCLIWLGSATLPPPQGEDDNDIMDLSDCSDSSCKRVHTKVLNYLLSDLIHSFCLCKIDIVYR